MELRGLTLNTINDITTRINSAQDLHSLLTEIMDTARQLLNSEASSLLLYDDVSDELIFDIARGDRGKLLAEKRIPLGQGIAGMCAQTRETIVVNDAENDSRVMKSFDKEIDFTTRNLLAVPMLARGEMIGVLEVLNTEDNRDYEKRDIRLLNYLSNMAALAIRNRRLYEDVRDRAEELNCLYEISQSMSLQDDLEELLDSILESIQRVLAVERVSVLLREEGDERLKLQRMRGFSVEDHDERIDPAQGIAGIVLRSGDPLLVRDIEKELRLMPERAGQYRTKSFISVPVKNNDQVVGILNAADKKDGTPFDYFELRVLSTIAVQLGDAFGRFNSRRREQELKSYRKDLETAAMIQMNSLPRIPAVIAGLEIATRYEASRDVGGDFYDLIYHSDDRISVLMADVAGKGVPAALFMEYSKTLLGAEVPRNLDPVTTLQNVNQEIVSKSQMGLFVTVMLIQLEREMHRFRMASAGHNRQVLYRRNFDALEILSTKGPPVGIFGDSEYMEKIVEYTPGDLLLLYTDGITEANNHKFEEFGEERLFDIVKKNGSETPAGLIDIIFSEVQKFRDGMEPSDDSTMMVVRL